MTAPAKKKPKSIINDPSDAVAEFIEGLLLQYPNKLVKLANHNVLLAAESVRKPTSNVLIVSGGGSGHEPSHAGWLGPGMLSAAVCGGMFASPSVSTILATIRALSSTNAGVLLIVKNYTGDRLNFGMAAERANQQEGIHVNMVVVADDCALPRSKGITGARGVAGTVFVHKIAGAAAARGQSLDAVTAVAKQAASLCGTLGIALNSVTVPGAAFLNDRLSDDATIEIGLGIHGEAGVTQSPLLTADEIAKQMVTRIQDYGRLANIGDAETIVPMFNAGDQICILVNNLGGTSNFEMSILARSCIRFLESDDEIYGRVKVTRVFVGSFMTSFDMHGASLTILNATNHPELVQLLDSPTGAPAWAASDIYELESALRPSVAQQVPEVVVDEASPTAIYTPPLEITNFAAAAKALLAAAAQKLSEAEPLLTKYDTIVGDGDAGITMKRGSTEILNRLSNETLLMDHPVTMFGSLADAVSASMGGTSGVLLELMFRKMSSTLSRGTRSIAPAELCKAFEAGVQALSLYGGASIGSRTMMDALIPVSAALVAHAALTDNVAKVARKGADGTALMKSASAGRSNYLSEDTLMGTPDPGAEAVAIVFEALVGAASF